ncbi:MAG TPA: lantibiotic dehydratase C-terminal domain-containing protein [Allosphingosinicella sp.]|nr:lantibiotic dehydratase C-terminal domain-containing protein [Allosphingosinicella sp.]
MMMIAQPQAWRAFHVFYFDDEHVDELLIETGRLISELAPSPAHWFFIRYQEGGMHLRFRLREGSEGFAELSCRVRDKAWALGRSAAKLPEVPAGGGPDERGHFHYPGSVVEIPYVPETDRYGGPDALSENEALFQHSTSIAMKVIGATLSDWPKRAKLAIDLMLAVATVAEEDEKNVGRFFEAYSRFWAERFQIGEMAEDSRVTSARAVNSRLQKLREYAASDSSPETPSQSWLRRLHEAKRRFEDLSQCGKLVSPADRKVVNDRDAFNAAVSDMLMSQLHMMNNRLGFAPYLEMMWAGALARSLAR